MRSSSSSSSSRDKYHPGPPSPLPGKQKYPSLPPLREAIPEISSSYQNNKNYPLNDKAQGPGPYPANPSLWPSPPPSRSRFPPSSSSSAGHYPSSSSSSSSYRSSNGHHHHDYADRQALPSEMHLPMHSGPPNRNSGSPSSYSDNRHLGTPSLHSQLQTPERGPVMNGKSPEHTSLPPIHQLTQPAGSYTPSHLPPMNPNPRPPIENGYSRSLPPQPPHMDPHYSQSGGYMHHTHDSYSQSGQEVQFQNVEVGEKSNKKRRGNLPKHTTDVLRAWLNDHLDHAYPSEEQKQHLIRETGLTDKQVGNWFINARRRNVPRLIGQAKAERELMASQPSSSQSPSEDSSPPGRRSK
ncbi:MAG: hypothetical protein Q9223_003035 [Gallowayella weberi]